MKRIAQDFLTFFMMDNTTPTNGQRVVLGLMFFGYLFFLAVISPFIALGWCGDKLLRAMNNRAAMVALLIMVLLPAMALASPESFITNLEPYLPIVQHAGLYPSVFIAQSALETGWGRSEAVQYFNYWGIKCRAAPCFSKQTWEIYDGQYWQGKLLFQAYPDLAAGVQAYCDKINFQREYQGVERSNRDSFIDTLAKVWATDPDYAWKLRSIIRVWGLEGYDPG